MTRQRRCIYCGHRCYGVTCSHCRDLVKIQAGMVGDAQAARRAPGFAATCGRCGSIATTRQWFCADCGTPLYLSRATKGKAS